MYNIHSQYRGKRCARTLYIFPFSKVISIHFSWIFPLANDQMAAFNRISMQYQSELTLFLMWSWNVIQFIIYIYNNIRILVCILRCTNAHKIIMNKYSKKQKEIVSFRNNRNVKINVRNYYQPQYIEWANITFIFQWYSYILRFALLL